VFGHYHAWLTKLSLCDKLQVSVSPKLAVHLPSCRVVQSIPLYKTAEQFDLFARNIKNQTAYGDALSNAGADMGGQSSH